MYSKSNPRKGIYIEDRGTVVKYFQEELRFRNEDISKTYLEDISKGEVTTPYQASLNIVQFKTFQS